MALRWMAFAMQEPGLVLFAWCLEFTGDAMDDVLQNLWISFEMDWTAGGSLPGDFNNALCRYFYFYVNMDVDTDKSSVEHRTN